jgi:hypothetical protein
VLEFSLFIFAAPHISFEVHGDDRSIVNSVDVVVCISIASLEVEVLADMPLYLLPTLETDRCRGFGAP